MKTEADGLGIETCANQAEGVLTTLLDQFLTATDLLGATAGLRVDLLRWMIVALVGIGGVALVRAQPTG